VSALEYPYATVKGRRSPLIPIHTVDIQLRHYRFSGQIGFSEHLGVSFNVIGRIPLFERCIVCFDDRQGLVRLEPYNLS